MTDQGFSRSGYQFERINVHFALITCNLDIKHYIFSVLSNNHGPLSQEFAKKGCPISLRADLWCQILGIEVDEFVSTVLSHFIGYSTGRY